jgi:stearoyl-CoA desaturase (delta-9 desaturase)
MSSVNWKNFNWTIGGFIIIYQSLFLISFPFYLYFFPPKLSMILWSVILLALTVFGIGVYHRHYSHCGYKLSKWVEPFFLFFATAAFQGSAIWWSHDHRKHHHFVDTDGDPYAINKGFWHAHVLWLLERSQPKEMDRYVPDLLKNKLLVFQHKYYLQLAIGTNVLLWLAVGFMLHDFIGAFVLAWWGRLFVSHHVTWFINSLAHYWGERTYSKEHSAVDNYMMAFFTGGEGYHNYHHTFPADYRNGIRWYHFDPNKWLVWTLSKLGLASSLLRYPEHAIQERLLLADKQLFLDKLSERAYARKAELEDQVQQLAVSIQEKLHHMRALAEQKRAAFKSRRKELGRELREVRRSVRAEWRQWHEVGRAIVYPRIVR